MRAPFDVINLGILFEIPQQHSRQAMVENAAAIVSHGDVRAHVHKGIVRVEKISGNNTCAPDDEPEMKDKSTDEIK